MSAGRERKRLCINRCARHNFYSISIDDEIGGLRVTPSKCCGSWSTVKEWELSERDWRDLATEAIKAADEMSAHMDPQP